MIPILFLSLSICLQFLAAGRALFLVRKSEKIMAWLLMSFALFLMAVRRSVTLFESFESGLNRIDLMAESIALVISCLMVVGVWLISGVFEKLQSLQSETQQELDKRKKVEGELNKKHDLLRKMEEIAKVGGWELDPETGKVIWTDEVARIHDLEPGVDLDAVKGMNFYWKESRAKIEQAVNAALEFGTPYDLELEIVSAKGVHKWVRTNGVAEWMDGKVVRLRGAFQDISKRKHDEEALLEISAKQKQLSEILENSSQAFGVGYPDGRLALCNPAFCTLTGYSLEELEQLDWNLVLTPPEWRESEQKVLSQLVETGKPVRYQKEYIRKDGKRVPIELLAHSAQDKNGEDIYFYAFITDITEKQRVDEELRKYREHLEELVETRAAELTDLNQLSETILKTVPVGIITYHSDGQCVDANRGATEILGINHEELTAQNFREISIWKESGLLKVALKCLETGEDVEKVITLKKRGEPPQILETGFARFILNQTPHLLLTFTDITHRVKAEEKLKAFSRDLESSNRELEAFTYSVSHDLRAPLRSIDGFSQALLEDYEAILDDEAQDHLQRIRSAAQRMGILINDLLQISRISRWELQFKNLDLAEMAKFVFDSLQENSPGCKVDMVIQKGLQAAGDPRLMRLVLDNLIGNAWKFSRTKEAPRIEVGRLLNCELEKPHKGFDDEEPVFFVRDNGVGFDMTYSDKLFGAFQRLHTLSEFEGTGIGLATVMRAILRQGGRVWGESQLGEGAVFYFTMGTRSKPYRMDSNRNIEREN